MAFLEGWFYVNRKEQQQRLDDMSEKIFQFGDEAQRPAVVKVLGDLYGNERRFSSQDQMYAFISAKNQYVRNVNDARAQLKKLGWKDDERIRLMIALLELDGAAESLNAYPTAADVRRRAGLV